MTNHLKFVSFTPGYFAGLNQDSGAIFNGTDMVLIFPQDKNITELSGDQGTGKTSTIECLKMLVGGEEASNALNATANDLRATLELVDEEKGHTLLIKRTRSSFSIERREGEGGKIKSTVKEPKTFLRDLIGNIGLNPMDLKGMKGKEQIEWLRKVQPFTGEQAQLEADILKRHKEAFDTRTEINRKVKELHKEVSESGYYQWDIDNKVFYANAAKQADEILVSENDLDETAINERFATAEKFLLGYNNGKQRVEQYKIDAQKVQDEISELERKLDLKRKELGSIEEHIENGQKWLDERKGVQAEYDAARQLMLQSGELRMKQQKLQKSEAKHNTYEEKLREQLILNSKLDELTALHKQLIKESTPNIPGLEVIIGGIDTKEEGLWYKEMPIANSCESEIWEFFFQLPDMHIVFLENISSLGSGAVEQINNFVANGGRVFSTIMNRKQPSLKVSFLEKIAD